GWIKRILPVVDPRSGTVKVTLEVPSSEGLLPGMYVEVELVAEVDADALLVPKRALIYDQEQVFVFRVDEDGRVERRLVQPTLENRDFVRISDGLDEGDQIVVAGQAGLKDGSEVRLLDLQEAIATFADSSAQL
ncbi:MAG: efflux RND transporter periplasmic adaptor subunit, partial [Myxococcota bacterium]